MRRVVPLLVGVAGAASLGVLAGYSTTLSWSYVLVGVAMLLSVLPFVRAVAQRRFDPFEPVYLFALSFAVLFALRPIFDLNQPGGVPSFVGYALQSTYTAAVGVGVAGAIGFYIGYFSRVGNRLGQSIAVPSGQWVGSTLYAFMVLGTVVSLSLFAIFLASQGGLSAVAAFLSGRNLVSGAALHTSSGYLYAAPLWLTSFAVLLLARMPRWRSLGGVIAFMLLGLSQFTEIALGDRAWTLPALAAVVVTWYLRRGKRPALWTAGFLLVAVFIVGVTVPRQYRTTVDRQAGLAQTVLAATLDPGLGVAQFFGGGDTAMVDALAVELQFVPGTIPYQFGRTYLEELTRPFPRSFWSGKPVAADTQLMSAIWPDYNRAFVGFSFSLFGEPYLNLGFIGVLLFGLVFGALCKALYAWFLRDRLNPAVITIFALSWPLVFVYARGGIGADYHRQLIYIVPVLLAIVLAGIRRAAPSTGVRDSRPTVLAAMNHDSPVPMPKDDLSSLRQ
jgi:oligosaccharide repeat unit polymerase